MQKTKINAQKLISEMDANFEKLKEGIPTAKLSKSGEEKITKELEKVIALAEKMKAVAEKQT